MSNPLNFFKKQPLNKSLMFLIILSCSLCITSIIHAKTEQTDRALTSSCSGCHGPDGISSGPSVPSIAGLPSSYFAEIMLGFKLDQLPATVMGTIAKAYEKDELEQLAALYASKPFSPAIQPFSPQLAKKGAKLHEEYCEGCHEKGGSSGKDKEVSILAGQHLLYLRWTLDDLKRKKRVPTRKMAKKMRKLMKNEGNAGLDALVHYYASQQ